LSIKEYAVKCPAVTGETGVEGSVSGGMGVGSTGGHSGVGLGIALLTDDK